ncbi:zinc ribbon domain-containing protein [Dehalococcoidia bacterium]|nr:zinc ribbon domain-containing protein [Dehalococcoidia bacterium]MCL0078922.1 zinc ribbon domain-containing protein [Dehalococcoidia bacterium]MCL0080034.1 zinc ribbon domain-containing protein [Dehalococcoidia bacterium]MCL0089164.1 zinc ribbon domain-containing protein [Dehalococcoidia bacterium]MCL0093612.1 zinc ribbon domain-containing protein [Dehalococcoidia bacterium]
MPIYEYRCTTCDCDFEIRQGFDTEPFSVCPRCRNTARRIFRPAPIIFKGSGFYVTDYGSGSSTMARSKSEETKETETKAEPASAAASKPAGE